MAWKAFVRLWFPMVGLLVLSGCGPDTSDLPATVPASGVVLLDGTPVHGASIVFAPQAPGKYPAFGMSDKNGRFEMKAFEAKSGAVPGSYKVMISKTIEVQGEPAAAPPPGSEDAAHAAEGSNVGLTWVNELPAKYQSFETSGLTVTVPEEGISDIKFELSSN